MNGTNFTKYEVVKSPKGTVLNLNPEEILKEAEDKEMNYHILGVSIPLNKTTDPLLYHPGMPATSSTEPFNPFYFIREELIPIYSSCGKQLHDNTLNHISSDYGISIIMDNICIILEYGLFGQLRKYLVPGRPTDRFNEECLNVMYDCRGTLRYRMDAAMGPVNAFKKDKDYGSLTMNNVPTVVLSVCESLSRSLSEFIVNIITLGCINITVFNNDIYEEANSSIGTLVNIEDLSCDVSSIISFLTFMMNNDIEKISEVVEIGVVAAIDYEIKSNNIYNQYTNHCPQLKELLTTDLNNINTNNLQVVEF